MLGVGQVPVAFAIPLAVYAVAAQSNPVEDALYRLSREAAGLWQAAPRFLARETMIQRMLTRSANPEDDEDARFETREIVSFYSLGAYAGAPEALHEFRQIVSINGKNREAAATARRGLIEGLVSGDNQRKRKLAEDFEKSCGPGSATDFGQLILLFTKSNLDQYAFKLAGQEKLGTNAAWRIAFEQQTGRQSLRIQEPGRKMRRKLEGTVLVRQGDYLPLRISLSTSHDRGPNMIRDQAQVDYRPVAGVLLPSALRYQRFINEELVIESKYEYTGWEPM